MTLSPERKSKGLLPFRCPRRKKPPEVAWRAPRPILMRNQAGVQASFPESGFIGTTDKDYSPP